jgi:FtsP/CotA-like multicopper oxidase with cupredoxin domain
MMIRRVSWLAVLASAASAVVLLTGGGPAGSKSGATRVYYIAADRIAWDYAPSGRDQLSGRPFDQEAKTFVERGPQRIGHVYRKGLYREYTDATFTTLKPPLPEWKHLGMLGPAIHAEVGDTIKIVFRNNLPFPASIHPHGVFYEKDSEGAPYADGTNGANKRDDIVPPRGTHTYTWPVPERAGPGPGDPSSILWMYHSHASASCYSPQPAGRLSFALGSSERDGPRYRPVAGVKR